MSLLRVTIVSIPKPFVGHIGTIQRNAIRSWVQLRPRPDVILVGDEAGTRDIAGELSVRHVPAVDRNEYGTPLLSSAFAIAKANADTQMLCYVNADIILLSGFTGAIARIGDRRCLVVGHRTNLDLLTEIDFEEPGWEARLERSIAVSGRLHSPRGMDYFVFPRGLWDEVPPFAIGRLMWDNWLVADARRRGVQVIDATRVITAVHQSHGYSVAIRAPHGGWDWNHPEAGRNLEIAGGHDRSFNIRDATHVLLRAGVWPALGADYLRQRLERLLRPRAAGLRPMLERAAVIGALRVHGLLNRVRRAMSVATCRGGHHAAP